MKNVITEATKLAKQLKHIYVTPEHVMYTLCTDVGFARAVNECGGDIGELKECLKQHFNKEMDTVDYAGSPDLSHSMQKAIEIAKRYAMGSGTKDISSADILYGISQAYESYACYYLEIQKIDCEELIYKMKNAGEEEDSEEEDSEEEGMDLNSILKKQFGMGGNGFGIIVDGPVDGSFIQHLMSTGNAPTRQEKQTKKEKPNEAWKKLVTNLNESVKLRREPLVGREDVIERTIQILCRKYKSNAIHVGEPGVGKTAITMGIAKLLNSGNVPEQLKGATIYSLDMGSLVAGTQFRGQFEKKIEVIMSGLQTVKNPIVYIDEIHTMVGAGAGAESSLDASNMIKKHLTEGKIKFIGATTYEEYKKYFEKDKALNRRFKMVEVRETTVEETTKILNGIKQYYEDYHNVTFTDKAIKSAVELSDKYIAERFLPDKAIDLLDEAGSYVALHRTNSETLLVDSDTIEEVLAKSCNIPKQSVESGEIKNLYSLDKKIKDNVFGQDLAVDELTRCIKMSRAGLNDDNKPVASMLFVGPTGTGKTEIARKLAEETGVKLIRFDMSDYQEKHAVAKLIGSPAGYVGYEEGGLLTEAIRKNPHCVLLLDEIEKAHGDIYNILLPVMDYATLTDNQGRKADFRNVVIIMTSNAGARDIVKKNLGFGNGTKAESIDNEAMDKAVKAAFTPEFRNRLTKIVKFNTINDEMALLIAEKQFKSLKAKIEAKGIKVTVTKKCYKAIADKGTSIETGAREIQRIIDMDVKPLFVDEMLFGSLSNGGKCRLNYTKDGFKVTIEKTKEA